MSNQIYMNQNAKYYAMPGYNQWTPTAPQTVTSNTTLVVLFNTQTVEVDDAQLVVVSNTGGITLLKDGVYAINCYLSVTQAGSSTIPATLSLYNTTIGASLMVTGSILTAPVLGGAVQIPLSACAYFPAGTTFTLSYDNTGPSSQSIGVASQLSITKVY